MRWRAAASAVSVYALAAGVISHAAGASSTITWLLLCAQPVQPRIRRFCGRRAGAAIDLQVRGFFCGDPACSKRTFAGQADRLVFSHGRRSVMLERLPYKVALTHGGHVAVPVSGPMLLRLI